MNIKNVVTPILITLPLLLAGCGGGSSESDDSSSELSITPSLGKVSNAEVILFQSDGSTQLARGELADDGTIKISYSGSYSGPIIVAVKGDSDAVYFDEASNTTVSFGAGKLLRAIVPSGTKTTGVTPLTEVAYQLSLNNSIALTDQSVDQLNERVRKALAPEILSIIEPPTLFDDKITAGDLKNTDAGRYALRLAALAQLGASNASPALSIAEQLAQDMADGVIDGKSSDNAISGLLYDSNTLASTLDSHLTTFATKYGAADLKSALSGYAAITKTVDVKDLLKQGAGNSSLPSFVSGKIVTMEYNSAATGSPYANGDKVLFSFSSSGSLMLTDQYTLVAKSFTVRGNEYVWSDATNNLEYALSVSNNAINEVNVFGSGTKPFYGQFTLVKQASDPVTLDLTGDGAALAGGSGATGTANKTTYTYTGHPVAGSPLYSSVPTTKTGFFTAYDGTNALTKWTIYGFPTTLGTYQCGGGGTAPFISLTLSGVPYLSASCKIEVTSVSTTEVEGRFAVALEGSNKTSFSTVSDGYFRYKVPETPAGNGLGQGELGYSMDVNGKNVTVNNVPALDGADRQVADYLTLGDTPTFQINMIPEGKSGSYTCGQGPNAYRRVAMSYQGHSSNNSGSCTVDVVYANGVYSGTYSGTLYSNTGDKMVITNGVLRNDGSSL
ncbi:hypothetical protein DN730_02850 [Marinomonas piezotolerans]|uniref:Uncharacterized protein n=1 Tax=Marinomonas piezotolerans TaxID=2213058 RepID=A0A370UDZ3_9GAMM|nr:hypothetical protein [Marinomonas piezotolerans]RDL45996.1 hypothetical protein DN730_02850 [Marinomonas piezotolerans]